MQERSEWANTIKEAPVDFLEETVKHYYASADTKNWDSLLRLFASNIVYQRGNRLIVGIDELETFYKSERIVQAGSHVYTVKVMPPVAFVTGTFHGSTKDGEQIHVEFEDTFIFEDDKIIKRTTKFQGREI